MGFRINKNISSNIVSDIKEDPSQIELTNYMNKLADTLPVIQLRNSDFLTGTYRIKQKGYYVLAEDITFNPNPSTWDGEQLQGDNWLPTSSEYPVAPYGPYHLGFFAAITVEADDVIIDLNNFLIEQHIQHYLQQRFFSVIELASSPFIPKQGPSNFGDSVKFVKNVMIKNGRLGRSSHQAIHGNGMQNIIIENIQIFNFEQCGIALNGGKNMILKNIDIDNSSLDVVVNATYSQSRFMLPFLKKIVEHGNPSITIRNETKTGSTLIKELEDEMNSVFKDFIIDHSPVTSPLFKNSSSMVDGNIYGIILNVLGVAVNDYLEYRHEDANNKDILMQNVNIVNLSSNPTEVIGLSTTDKNKQLAYGLPSQKGPVGDVFRIFEVRDENEFYIPNPHANAQCYISKYKHLINGGGTSSIEEHIYNNWIASQIPLSSVLQEEQYFYNNQDSMAHVMKGTIGLFLSGTQNLKMYNILIEKVNNFGPTGDTSLSYNHSDIYQGNRCRGLAIVASNNIYCNHLNINSIESKTADVVGIDFINKSKNVRMESCTIKNLLFSQYLHCGDKPNVNPKSTKINGKENVTNFIFTPSF